MARAKAKKAVKVKAKSKSKAAGTKKSGTKKSVKPIDLYYWPTPNGFKISIMLEECGAPYNMIPVNISKGEQFTPQFLKISPEQPHAGDRRSRRAGRQA